MPSSFTIPKNGFSGFKGYISNPANASAEYLSSPSVNCLVTEDGKAESRMGYRAEFSIGVDGSPAKPFYHPNKEYDIAFFALGTKLYYRDFTTAATYDTGITLTDGTTTRFDEINEDVYLTNTVDGLYRIMVTRLNGAVSIGGDITVDVDGASRLTVFGDTSDVIRINGVDETYISVDVTTGVLDATSSAVYPDNAIAIFVDGPYSSLEKGSKVLIWKRRMHLMGYLSASNADQPINTVAAGKFTGLSTITTGIEDIVDFTYGAGGSTLISVGGGGRTTNILGVADYLYFFNSDRVFATAAADIPTSGSTLGLTIPNEKDMLHGCINEDCATVMGNNAISYIDYGRFMRIPIDTDTGAPLSAPDEDYDVDIRALIKNMDKDQTGALNYHYRGGRQTLYQVRIQGQWYLFIFDHNIIRVQGSANVRGAWQPPQQITPFRGFFERNGVLYGTDPTTDTVYSIFTASTDNLIPIQVTIATGEFNVGQAMMKKADLRGEINQPSEINIHCYVTNEMSGRRTGSAKIISGSNYTYGEDHGVGNDPVGDGGVEFETISKAKWHKDFDIYPSEASFVQLIAENFVDGGYFSISAFSLTGDQYEGAFTSSL